MASLLQQIWQAIAVFLMQSTSSKFESTNDASSISDQEFLMAIKTDIIPIVDGYLHSGRNIDRLMSFRGIRISPAQLASFFGRKEVLKRLLLHGINVHLRADDGETALYFASLQGHPELVELLIKAQASVNLKTKNGYSPIFVASQQGHHEVVSLLIDAEADVNSQISSGESPLYVASQCGHQEVVDLLIKAHAQVDLQQNIGASALFIASQKGLSHIANSLIKAGTHVDLAISTGESPLFVASQNNHFDVVCALIKAQADVNFQQNNGGTSLCMAAQEGHSRIVDLLIKAQADVNLQVVTGESPLFLASRQGHHKVVDLLIKAGANINLQTSIGMSSLYISSQNGHHEVVDLLIKAQADLDLQTSTGESPIYIASQVGHHKVVQLLIEAHADVNLSQSLGQSPLHVSSKYGHYQIVNLLIGAQADVNLQTSSGVSPLFTASQNGHHQVVDSLIRARADVNLQRKTGTSPICMASDQGHYLVVDSLIKAQADTSLTTKSGISPLYIASQAGHHSIVNLLIKAQADVDIQRKTGESAILIASQQGHQPVVDQLIKANADIDLQTTTGESPLYMASQEGLDQVVDSLIKAQADVNLRQCTGASPVLVASLQGYHQVVASLIKAHANIHLRTVAGETALSVAAKRGHHRVIVLLKAVLSETEDVASMSSTSTVMKDATMSKGTSSDDTELSHQLHLALNKSGFVDCRAAMQSAVADVLQEIMRMRLNSNLLFIVGSFSEGWGNNLTTLDGTTDIESDIDVMTLIPGRLYHLVDLCKCDDERLLKVEYSNGHIICPGFASVPARPSAGSVLKPAVDEVSACRLCCYPPIAPHLPDRIAKSNISQPVLQSLEDELSTSPCHVVHAAPPGQAGEQLRVSTTFLEKRLLRSLTTLQGQMFVMFKYLVKKVICSKDGFNVQGLMSYNVKTITSRWIFLKEVIGHKYCVKVQGLKSYHVKSITFRILEETPAEQWKPENLVSLTRRSLQMLLDSLESSCRPDNADGRIMDHFFLCDAALYLKGANRSSALDIMTVLRDVIHQLPRFLTKFIGSQTALSNSNKFYFHPFLLLPNMQINARSQSVHLRYHEIYDVVWESLLRLSQGHCSNESQESLSKMIDRLPDCARSAREALRALACLKFGNREAAVKVLRDCRGHEVSRGIPWSAERSKAEATAELVWQHLRSCDSAWKFCFEHDRRPELHFLPPVLMKFFPLTMQDNYNTYFYVNFDALLRGLRLLLAPCDATDRAWMQDVAQRLDTDEQELMMLREFVTEKAAAMND